MSLDAVKNKRLREVRWDLPTRELVPGSMPQLPSVPAGIPTDTPKDDLRTLVEREPNFLRWIEHPTSSILHHDRACCDEARLWFLAFARSMEIGVLSQYEIKAPTWLLENFTWGPTEWPISWCEVVQEEIIDCGVFAALAREVFAAQGHSVHPAQALLRYNADCTMHWRELWKGSKSKKDNEPKGREKKEVFPWIGNELVYHELCVLELPDGTAKLYDATAGNWYLPESRSGFSALLAVRTDCPRVLTWNKRPMICGEWMEV